MAKAKKNSWKRFVKLNRHHGIGLRSLKDAWDNGEREEMTAETAMYYAESDPLSFGQMVGPKTIKRLRKEGYKGMMERKRRKNPGTSVLGALILGGIIGHSMKKK